MFCSISIRFLAGLLLANTALVVVANDKYSDAPEDAVTCGSAIKLAHLQSSTTAATYQLSSANMQWSGQQIVTVVRDKPSEHKTMWLIRGPNDPAFRKPNAACEEGTGTPVMCGQIIRLTHLETQKNLHSHNNKSPLSRQQEITGFGQGDGNGDNGDDWKVHCGAAGSRKKYWQRGNDVWFEHVDTARYLGASDSVKFNHQNCGHNCAIMNELEAFGRSFQDTYGAWSVESGVHIHK